MKNVNDKLPEQMKVPALEDGESAIYVLLNAGGWDPVNKRPVKPAGHIMSGRYTINDKSNNRRIIIQNVQGYRDIEQPDGTIVQVAAESMVRFDKTCIITCQPDDYELMVFLERHPANNSNPWKDPKVTPIFKKVDAVAEALASLQTEEMELDARMLVRDTIAVDKIRAMAAACGIAGYDVTDPVSLKSSLTAAAKATPLKVIKAGNDQKLIKKVNIIEAQKLVILGYDESEKVWYWRDDPSKRQVLQVDEAAAPLDALVAHYSSKEGQRSYRTLIDKIKKLE